MEEIMQNAISNTNERQFEGVQVNQANIKVIGVGGAGNNMVSWLYKKGIKGAEIIACNTDQQHLDVTGADRKFLIGREVTKKFEEFVRGRASDVLEHFQNKKPKGEVVIIITGSR